jgi:hypothetical protein
MNPYEPVRNPYATRTKYVYPNPYNPYTPSRGWYTGLYDFGIGFGAKPYGLSP